MSALVNGTYTISSILRGGDQFYLGFSSGATGGPLVIDFFTGSESGQWDVESSNVRGVYTFRNRRYQTYISSSTSGRVVAATDPRNWHVTPADSGYVVGTNGSATLVWNVEFGAAEKNTNIILYSFDSGAMNEFWKFSPIQAPPSSTSSSSELPSESTSTAEPSSTCGASSCPVKEGLDLGTKIGLGTGLGIGIPGTLATIIAIYIALYKKQDTVARS